VTTRYLTLALIVAATALAIAAVVPPSRPALLGAGIAAGTALASLAAFALTGRSPARAIQKALGVFAAMFLVRILLVALGLIAVRRAGESPLAFAVAFFVPYFVFAAIEGGFVHSLGRRMGRTA
jgi:hypothetical protein